MTITEFIAKLEQLRAEHGDLEVASLDDLDDLYPSDARIETASRLDHGAYPEGQKVVLI